MFKKIWIVFIGYFIVFCQVMSGSTERTKDRHKYRTQSAPYTLHRQTSQQRRKADDFSSFSSCVKNFLTEYFAQSQQQKKAVKDEPDKADKHDEQQAQRPEQDCAESYFDLILLPHEQRPERKKEKDDYFQQLFKQHQERMAQSDRSKGPGTLHQDPEMEEMGPIFSRDEQEKLHQEDK